MINTILIIRCSQECYKLTQLVVFLRVRREILIRVFLERFSFNISNVYQSDCDSVGSTKNTTKLSDSTMVYTYLFFIFLFIIMFIQDTHITNVFFSGVLHDIIINKIYLYIYIQLIIYNVMT
jgi:hypothetical protein